MIMYFLTHFVQDVKILNVQILLLCVTFCKLSLSFHIFCPHRLFVLPSQLTVSSLHSLVLLYLSTPTGVFYWVGVPDFCSAYFFCCDCFCCIYHVPYYSNIQIVMWWDLSFLYWQSVSVILKIFWSFSKIGHLIVSIWPPDICFQFFSCLLKSSLC
jgi:hypothetical protein